MYQIRVATPADAAIITHHRRRMFVDAGRQNNRVLDVMAEHFKPWVETRLEDGRYLGWLASENGTVVAGAGLIVLDWPPHPLDPRQNKRGYLLNVYVEPEHRRKKLASQLIDQALAEARRQKIRVVALHSTDAGKPLYESNGFRSTDEMFIEFARRDRFGINTRGRRRAKQRECCRRCRRDPQSTRREDHASGRCAPSLCEFHIR